ncbi:hypothetical protein H6P81_016138 [Aristolochia fimbriata]|uniref:Uncharacterized protein n=1 Tax=Aristolochia fimbriata TaxID=158543 RepID=A0AAV7EC31_ARIFI|nr:hypothetical protein H6P81_016138 [Aristolochia fimbriata]
MKTKKWHMHKHEIIKYGDRGDGAVQRVQLGRKARGGGHVDDEVGVGLREDANGTGLQEDTTGVGVMGGHDGVGVAGGRGEQGLRDNVGWRLQDDATRTGCGIMQ